MVRKCGLGARGQTEGKSSQSADSRVRIRHWVWAIQSQSLEGDDINYSQSELKIVQQSLNKGNAY